MRGGDRKAAIDFEAKGSVTMADNYKQVPFPLPLHPRNTVFIFSLSPPPIPRPLPLPPTKPNGHSIALIVGFLAAVKRPVSTTGLPTSTVVAFATVETELCFKAETADGRGDLILRRFSSGWYRGNSGGG